MTTAITSSFAAVTQLLGRWRYAYCLFDVFRNNDQHLGRAENGAL
jgi:hypothetical protein